MDFGSAFDELTDTGYWLSAAMMFVGLFIPTIVAGIEEALVHPNLPPSLAETISSRHVDVEYRGPEVSIEVDRQLANSGRPLC